MNPLPTPPDPTAPVPGSAAPGAELTLETVGRLAGSPVLIRVQDRHDTLLRVLDGVVCLTVGGVKHVLRAGDETVIAAGAEHRITGVGGEARIVTSLRPAPAA